MRNILKLMIIPMLCTALWTGCESLEDTYSKYTGDGRIRYVAKVSELTAIPGWYEMKLTWSNPYDPAIESILILWDDGTQTKEVTIDKHNEEYVIKDLQNIVYTFTVYSVDENGVRSIEAVNYGRPYTFEHEVLATFTKVVTKQFKVGGDNLILFFDRWPDTLEEAALSYYKTGEGAPTVIELERMESGTDYYPQGSKFYTIPNIDFEKPVTIKRKARIDENMRDAVDFPEIVLDLDTRIFNNDFENLMKKQLRVDELTDAIIESVTQIDVDYTISSFEDILYFPNLATVNMAKNRYANPADYNWRYKFSTVMDAETSKFALQAANELMGAEINLHVLNTPASTKGYENYFRASGNVNRETYINYLDISTLPANLDYLDAADWEISATPSLDYVQENLEMLLDNDPDTYWRPPYNSTEMRTYAITIDMGAPTSFDGFKVVQGYEAGMSTAVYVNMYTQPNMLKIDISDDKLSWTSATYMTNENIIGTGNGETSLIYTHGNKTARYIRIQLNDQYYFRSNTVYYQAWLADFMPFTVQ